jgi:hypothetical protein
MRFGRPGLQPRRNPSELGSLAPDEAVRGIFRNAFSRAVVCNQPGSVHSRGNEELLTTGFSALDRTVRNTVEEYQFAKAAGGKK